MPQEALARDVSARSSSPSRRPRRRALLATGNVVGELARQLYGRGAGHVVSFERGLRAAIDATRALIAAGGREPIFEATFDHDGVSVRVDVLDRSEPQPKLIEVKSSARVKDHYLDDCAIQAWALDEERPRAAAGRRRDAQHRVRLRRRRPLRRACSSRPT